jgi:L-fuconolactonase
LYLPSRKGGGNSLQRREILRFAAVSAAGLALQDTAAFAAPGATAELDAIRKIDAHIHLFDPTRPGGVPWPTKDDAVLFKPALPPRYVALSAGHNVVGAIAIEASPLASDNQWLLKTVAANPVMVGAIGDLVPGSADYSAQLEKLHEDPLFLGIRYGNLWDRDLSADVHKSGFVDGLKALAKAGLVFESANPNPKLIEVLVQIVESVPDLRIVVDHLPHAVVPTDVAGHDGYIADLRALAMSPHVFVKLSEIPKLADGKLVTDPKAYQGPLDAIWEIFGEDRVLFGSDWPNADTTAPYDETLKIVQQYIATKSFGAAEKYYFKNSIAAYRWKPRRTNQR